jgi:Protein of unknown function (DUF429)
VRVVGVDLAAEPGRTAVAVLGWDDGKAVVEDLRVGADDEALLAALAAADKAGIDAPFGWPDAFAVFLAAHQAGGVPVPGGLTGQQWRRQLAWRRLTAGTSSRATPAHYRNSSPRCGPLPRGWNSARTTPSAAPRMTPSTPSSPHSPLVRRP